MGELDGNFKLLGSVNLNPHIYKYIYIYIFYGPRLAITVPSINRIRLENTVISGKSIIHSCQEPFSSVA